MTRLIRSLGRRCQALSWWINNGRVLGPARPSQLSVQELLLWGSTMISLDPWRRSSQRDGQERSGRELVIGLDCVFSAAWIMARSHTELMAAVTPKYIYISWALWSGAAASAGF